MWIYSAEHLNTCLVREANMVVSLIIIKKKHLQQQKRKGINMDLHTQMEKHNIMVKLYVSINPQSIESVLERGMKLEH